MIEVACPVASPGPCASDYSRGEASVRAGVAARAVDCFKVITDSRSKRSPTEAVLCSCIANSRAFGTIGISPHFIKEYEAAAKRFSVREICDAMRYIFEADLKNKGILGVNSGSNEILEILLLQIL